MKSFFKKINSLFFPLSNCERITAEFCKLINVAIPFKKIRQELEQHPDYPSLLSINDILNEYDVETLPINIIPKDVAKLQAPVIAQIKVDYTTYFTVISRISNETVTFFHPVKESYTTISLNAFCNIFTNIVLIAENNSESNRPISSKDFQSGFIGAFRIGIIPFLVFFYCTFSIIAHGKTAIWPVCFTLVSFLGVLVGTLLLIYELDQYNPTLKQICSLGKKTNCGAVLNSKASKIFGISWSTIGFSYFVGNLIALLADNIDSLPILSILSWINLIALPYILFSVYYQANVAKQWCVLCLSIQIILFLQFVIALKGGFLTQISMNSIPWSSVLSVLFCFSVSFFIIYFLTSTLREAKDNKESKLQFQRLKHIPDVFNSLLVKQKKLLTQRENIGIVLGNPNSRNKLLKICNPYCGACSKSHKQIQKLLENNPDLQVQIIYLTSLETFDYTAQPIRHFLALYKHRNPAIVRQALDNWYNAEIKNYEHFASAFPVDEKVFSEQNEDILEMINWCRELEAGYTPMLFFNGYQLPPMFDVVDLKYHLTVDN